MCGIVGIIGSHSNQYRESIKYSLESIRHRGPDEDGIKAFDNAILGHVRLSIIDLSSGQQPMLNNNKDIAITFNGEIYGFQQIRSTLEYDFHTHSDTEAILALYEKYAEELFEKLEGMFAFGIWDDKNQSLLLARDRFGEKPLYYAFGENGEFIFASEIKAILATKMIKPKISLKSLQHYMQYLYVHPSKTIYENIHTLPPAHYLVYKDGKVQIKRYFTFSKTVQIDTNSAIDIFKQTFDDAVQKQLVSDVDVGAFLSGGLDSSTVVAVASKYKRNLKTYSFGFEGNKSELGYAKEIAKRYETDHYELFANDVDIAQMLLKMADIYDEPFADSSNIPTYLISKLAREHLKVILTGDGADELLGGYEWWYKPLLQIGKDKEPNYKELLFRVLGRFLDKYYSYKAIQLRNANKYDTVKDAYLDKIPNFSNQECKELIKYSSKSIKNFSFEFENSVNDALKMDLEDYMAGDILVKTDRASMANSLELRAPFLDVAFASFCISLPQNLKITNESDKIILRKAYQDSWTESIKKRGKQGFGAPVGDWLKRDSVKELKKYYFDKNRELFELISYDVSKKYFEKDSYQTWILLVLSIWYEKNKEYFC